MDIASHTLILETDALEICNGLNISNHYHHVQGTNHSNNLPYHNWYHALCMVINCYNGASHYNLPLSSIRALCVAALWHDYDHSGGKYTDTINVSKAIQKFQKYHNSIYSGATRDYDSDLVHVADIIAVTEYPYVNKPFSIEQKIIRDADLMQVLQPTWYEMCIIGLGKEMSVKAGREITEGEMIAGQIEFLNSINLNTDWGNNCMSKLIMSRLQELCTLNSL